MENKVTSRIALLFMMGLMLQSCGHDLDLTGMVYSETEVNGRFSQSMEYNNNHPARIVHVSSNEYTLAFAGDCHVGETGNLLELLDSARSPHISALFLCGDNTTGLQEDYDRMKGILDTVSATTWFMTTGNHDLYHAGWNTYYPYFGPSVYAVSIEAPAVRDLVLVLDNSSGTVGNLQLDWIRSTLEEKRDDYRYCIVACHVNFFRNRFTVSTNPLTEEIWALVDLFALHRVNLLVSGHDHKRYTEVFGATTYLTMDAVKDAESQTSWLKLRVSADSLNYDFISFH
jgi:hypothetical protein